MVLNVVEYILQFFVGPESKVDQAKKKSGFCFLSEHASNFQVVHSLLLYKNRESHFNPEYVHSRKRESSSQNRTGFTFQTQFDTFSSRRRISWGTGSFLCSLDPNFEWRDWVWLFKPIKFFDDGRCDDVQSLPNLLRILCKYSLSWCRSRTSS